MFRSSSGKPSSSQLRLRIVSYNVLSSKLAQESHYPTLNPEHLAAENRLPVVLSKLKEEITTKKNDHRPSIFCLQEVAMDWEGPLHVFFAQHGYHVVAGRYGRPFNGYMGVLLAWPTASLELVDLDIVRLADTRPWPKRHPPQPNTLQKLWQWMEQLPGVLFPSDNHKKWSDGPPDHWELSQNRHNSLVTARLRDCANTSNEFVVGTYHMPCAYYCPMAMMIHSDLACGYVEKVAERTVTTEQEEEETKAATTRKEETTTTNDETKEEASPTTADPIPFILAGDFNIQPDTPVYDMLTTGKLDPDGPDYPTPHVTQDKETGKDITTEWKPRLKRPVQSAYAAHGTKEPDFTNYAKSGDDPDEPPFVATLDYIFCSQHWAVESVLPLPHRDESGGPFPNLEVNEPSDHVMIAADLVVKNND